MPNKLLSPLFGNPAEQGLTLAEMERPPRIIYTGDRIEITVWNSLDNSMLAVSSLNHRRDGDTVVLSGTQALVTEIGSSRTFTFAATDLGLDGRTTRYAWADPDGTVHPLAPNDGPG